VPLKIVYVLMRWLLGLVVLLSRSDRAKDAELLVLRHENAVLRRTAGRVRYQPADRAWFAALAPFIPRRRWAGVFPVTSATLLAWQAADGVEHRPDRRPPREGEPAMELPADPWRAGQARRHRCALDHL
jgi:putative transposase